MNHSTPTQIQGKPENTVNVHSERPVRKGLTPRHGWISGIWRADLERIRDFGEGDGTTVSIPVLAFVWIALCDLANEHRSNTFDSSIGIIRKRASVSRRTAFVALKVLEDDLEMVSHVQNPTANKKLFEASTWTIYPSKGLPSKSGALGNKNTTPGINDHTQNSLTGLNNPRSGVNRRNKVTSPVGLAAPDGGQPSAVTKKPVTLADCLDNL